MSIQTTPPPADPGQAEAYRPLSLPALAGLALALVAAACVLVGGLLPIAAAQPGLFFASLVLTPLAVSGVAALRGGRGVGLLLAALAGVAAWAALLGLGGLLVLSGRSPWVLPTWFWGLVACAAALSWVARGQIRASEGTVSGEGVARLGLLVSAAVGVIYGAYYASSMLAVQSQARACVAEYFDLMKQGDDVQAYLRTVPPKERSEASDPRELVETVHNAGVGPGEPGKFTGFREGPLFRMVRMGGADTQFDERGMTFEPGQKSYTVALTYRVRTPYYTFGVEVVAVGEEGNDAAGVRRRYWHVQSARLLDPGPEATDLGKELPEQAEAASALLDEFLTLVMEDKMQEAFLRTRPPAEREGEARKAALASPAWKEFIAGKTIDTRDLWAVAEVRGPALDEMRRVFDPAVTRKTEPLPVYGFLRNIKALAGYEVTDGGPRLTYGVRLVVRDRWGLPRLFCDFEMAVESAGGGWRVSGLRLLRATKATPDKGRGGPGG